MKSFNENLQWRYAVKEYDASKKVSVENIAHLKEAIRLAPSSFGLQPFRVLFVENQKVRAKLRQASYNQSQITDASHLIVFAVENKIDENLVDRYFQNLCRTRNLKLEGDLLAHRNSLLGSVSRMTVETKRSWAANQAYLALGFLLFAAALLEIDASPMEGFIPEIYDEILDLPQHGLNSVVIAAIGYRDPKDIFQNFIKVRRPTDEMFISV